MDVPSKSLSAICENEEFELLLNAGPDRVAINLLAATLEQNTRIEVPLTWPLRVKYKVIGQCCFQL